MKQRCRKGAQQSNLLPYYLSEAMKMTETLISAFDSYFLLHRSTGTTSRARKPSIHNEESLDEDH